MVGWMGRESLALDAGAAPWVSLRMSLAFRLTYDTGQDCRGFAIRVAHASTLDKVYCLEKEWFGGCVGDSARRQGDPPGTCLDAGRCGFV